MSLANLIRGKSKPERFATATPATFAIQDANEVRTVASIATVAVAEPLQGQTFPMAAEEEAAIRAWLALIEEIDPATIAEVIEQCQRDVDARDYFTGRAVAELPKPDQFPDDRRFCRQCSNLTYGGVCSVASPGGAVSAIRGYRPMQDILHRCAGYRPGVDDPDQRSGSERWPGMLQTNDTKGMK